MIFIYALRDPRDNVVRYVGSTANPRRRLNGHCCIGSAGSKAKRAWVAELAATGLRPSMEILEATTGTGYSEAESAWIACYAETLFNGRGRRLGDVVAPIKHLGSYIPPMKDEGVEVAVGTLYRWSSTEHCFEIYAPIGRTQ